MSDFKDMAAKKVQAMARGYIARKTGFGAKKKQKTGHKGGKPAKKKNPKEEDINAKIIQAAFRKYKEYSKKH